MRYFMVTYETKKNGVDLVISSVFSHKKGFFRLKEFQDSRVEKYGHKNIVITNIFEFKSKRDYNDFIIDLE